MHENVGKIIIKHHMSYSFTRELVYSACELVNFVN